MAYNDPGATAIDAEDGTLPVTVTGSVDTATVGTYTLTYTATDSKGLSSSATRTVIVEAPTNTAPVVTLNGSDENIPVNTTASELSTGTYKLIPNYLPMTSTGIYFLDENDQPVESQLLVNSPASGGNYSFGTILNILDNPSGYYWGYQIDSDTTPPTFSLPYGAKSFLIKTSGDSALDFTLQKLNNNGVYEDVVSTGILNNNGITQYGLDSVVLVTLPPSLPSPYIDLGAIATDAEDGTLPVTVTVKRSTDEIIGFVGANNSFTDPAFTDAWNNRLNIPNPTSNIGLIPTSKIPELLATGPFTKLVVTSNGAVAKTSYNVDENFDMSTVDTTKAKFQVFISPYGYLDIIWVAEENLQAVEGEVIAVEYYVMYQDKLYKQDVVSEVDTTTAGTYILTYTATDSQGLTGTATRTVTVQ